ncbi:hypothetical protein [Acidocella facilis]|uniref:hypothetical protein n=1 Tax=Acidocella facilis TaxID=525 RepID=UPI001F453EB8|nr:hypothetical protein [Acidocella facilis]
MELAPCQHGRITGSGVIDNPIQMQCLLARLQGALSLPARATPELAAMLKTQNITADASATATITAANYAGDEGGIMCRLEIPANEKAVHVSITHLRFDPRLPLAREITAYQKHRVKHLRRHAS